jgi:hypothetical protein
LRRLRKKAGEDLSDANIARVIKGMHTLDSSRPTITKKEACQILKISYNPTRLDKIIEEYNDKIEYRAKRRQQKRGTRATPDEIQEAVRAFLRGDGITDISARLYRSMPFVRSLIETVGVPTRGSNAEERSSAYLLPEQCVATEFAVGELVWSAKDHALAEILNEYNEEYRKGKKGLVGSTDYEKLYGTKLYGIFVYEWQPDEEYQHLGAGNYSTSLAYDLGSLKHLKEYGIDLKNIS